MSGSLDDSESASLVRREAPAAVNYTQEDTMQKQVSTDETVDEVDYVDTNVSVLSQFHEDAITQAGYGVFQLLVLAALGLGLAADTIELFVLAYVIPSAEVELCMNEMQKGKLGAITFLGMMIGSVIWGCLSDRLGRRRTLISSLTVNAIFGAISAFMPSYGTFMTTRFCSGVGIGGSIPVVFVYYCEFLSKSNRARKLAWLLVFWAIGGVFVALMAWLIIPKTGAGTVADELEHFSSWREFLLICSLPSGVALIGILFLPESPRYLLEAGREIEAMTVYKRIFRLNRWREQGSEYTLTELELPSYRSCKGIAPPKDSQGILVDVSYAFETFWANFLQLFVAPHRNVTQVLLVIWLTSAYGYYGLSIWFPEYIKLLKEEIYEQNTNVTGNLTYHDVAFTERLDNLHFVNSKFHHVNFTGMIFNHVVFQNCTLDDCSFVDVRSSKTFFKNSVINNTKFIDTDFFEYRFINTERNNVSMLAMIAGCHLDFDYNLHLKAVFLENLIGQLAIIPGSILAVLIVSTVSRRKIIGSTFLSAAVAALFIAFLNTNLSVVLFEAVFNCVFMLGWNVLDITTTEIYPTHLRGTGWGFLSSCSRLAGMAGNLTFGALITQSRLLVVAIVAALLLLGGLASIKLPDTHDLLV